MIKKERAANNIDIEAAINFKTKGGISNLIFVSGKKAYNSRHDMLKDATNMDRYYCIVDTSKSFKNKNK